MNWKDRYEPIKVGDTVRCIKNGDTYRGAGWIENKIFVVKEFNKHPCFADENRLLYWGANCGGVFSPHVEKVLK
jgi:hypothetical protein